MQKIVTVTLDKERHLKYNLNALILAEKITGKKLSELGKKKDNFDLEFLRGMLYAGLKWEDKELTLEEVGDSIDMDNLEEVTNKLGEAMQGLK
ncbi:TPA: hypothetical protein ACXNW8_001306 [Clostridium botulinum]|uniref:hypothetical protein n=1 Tax=Clostridium botulinum TaxID=1491 RepID=UPI001C9A5822|nr:hypothetical protein [Clostridium botulinum]MBY6909509.1 hypothetical protein [Clostridium botulinum]